MAEFIYPFIRIKENIFLLYLFFILKKKTLYLISKASVKY